MNAAAPARVLDPAAVHRAVSGLLHVRPSTGLIITLLNIVGMNALLLATFHAESFPIFLACAIVAGFFYTSVMMTTHDAIHHTLTGWYWFDEIAPRAIGWWVFWPHGLYAELHKMHHRLNGRDLADPELPTRTAAAYLAASRFGRWRMRHQWWLSLFVYGGFGMIARHVREGFQHAPRSAALRRALWTDALGIAVTASVAMVVIAHYGSIERYVIYLLCLERILGFFHQLRSHIEHYGLHGEHGSIVETRLFNCRNVRTSRLVSRFFNGLNYHSVHHAFPGIPFYHLKDAHARIAALCEAAGKPLDEGEGYVRTAIALARKPQFLSDETCVPVSRVEHVA